MPRRFERDRNQKWWKIICPETTLGRIQVLGASTVCDMLMRRVTSQMNGELDVQRADLKLHIIIYTIFTHYESNRNGNHSINSYQH